MSDTALMISVYDDAVMSRFVADCRARGIVPVHRSTVRGHPACEGPDSDNGQQFGWITRWTERPGVTIEMLVQTPESIPDARVIARRAAAAVRPVASRTWALITWTTNRFFDAKHPQDWKRVRAATGTTGGSTWVLTALVPRDFPLGPDDYRPTCVELEYRGDVSTTCTSEPGNAEFQRMQDQVFAFGIVPRGAEELELDKQDRVSDKPSGVVTRLRSHAVSRASYRFFAAALPADNCGVVVFDVTAGRHRAVAEAP